MTMWDGSFQHGYEFQCKDGLYAIWSLSLPTLKADFHIATNHLHIACDYYRGLDGGGGRGTLNNMETYLGGIATTVPQSP